MTGILDLLAISKHDVLGAASRADRRERAIVAEWGSVGWPNDNDPYDYGPNWDDGMTLVKVTLHRGRRPGFGKPLQPGLGAGMRVLAHIDARLWQTLPASTRVCVVFPRGDSQTPANGFVAFVAQKSPATGFDATTMMLPVPDGSTLNVGDANAVPVAQASPTKAALDALKGFAFNVKQASTLADVILSGLNLWTQLGGAIPTSTNVSDIKTTKVKLT